MVPRRALRGGCMIDVARQQWSEGARRLEQERADVVRYHQLSELVDAVVEELTKRLGRTFDLRELAELHARAEEWAREVVAESMPPHARVGLADTVLVLDAAFHRYARGAGDYRP